MSNLISSFIIDPVVRQARRFSSAVPPSEGPVPLSHANGAPSLASPAAFLQRHREAAESAPEEEALQSPEARSAALSDRFRQYSPFIRRPPSAVLADAEGLGDHDGTLQDASVSLSRSEPTTPPPSYPIDISPAPGMSSDPSQALNTQFRRLDISPSLEPAALDAAGLQAPERSGSPGAEGHNAAVISDSLPADDGMRFLRTRIHQIRDMKIAEGDKAKLMHSIMTERYNFLRPQSPSSFISHDRPFTPTSGQSVFSEAHVSSPMSTSSDVDLDNPFNVRPGDAEPTYRTRLSHHGADHTGEDEDHDVSEDEPVLGCQHYKRNVRVQCHQCRRWHTCRHCHDAVEDHNLNRRKTENMLCMACGTPQKAAEFCTQCGTQAARYYCDICKLWDDSSGKKIYHCIDCGICRRGEGLGKDFIHCKVKSAEILTFAFV